MVARTASMPKGSAAAPTRMTPAAPAPSVVRMMVPTLPGSPQGSLQHDHVPRVKEASGRGAGGKTPMTVCGFSRRATFSMTAGVTNRTVGAGSAHLRGKRRRRQSPRGAPRGQDHLGEPARLEGVEGRASAPPRGKARSRRVTSLLMERADGLHDGVRGGRDVLHPAGAHPRSWPPPSGTPRCEHRGGEEPPRLPREGRAARLHRAAAPRQRLLEGARHRTGPRRGWRRRSGIQKRRRVVRESNCLIAGEERASARKAPTSRSSGTRPTFGARRNPWYPLSPHGTRRANELSRVESQDPADRRVLSLEAAGLIAHVESPSSRPSMGTPRPVPRQDQRGGACEPKKGLRTSGSLAPERDATASSQWGALLGEEGRRWRCAWSARRTIGPGRKAPRSRPGPVAGVKRPGPSSSCRYPRSRRRPPRKRRGRLGDHIGPAARGRTKAHAAVRVDLGAPAPESRTLNARGLRTKHREAPGRRPRPRVVQQSANFVKDSPASQNNTVERTRSLQRPTDPSPCALGERARGEPRRSDRQCTCR